MGTCMAINVDHCVSKPNARTQNLNKSSLEPSTTKAASSKETASQSEGLQQGSTSGQSVSSKKDSRVSRSGFEGEWPDFQGQYSEGSVMPEKRNPSDGIVKTGGDSKSVHKSCLDAFRSHQSQEITIVYMIPSQDGGRVKVPHLVADLNQSSILRRRHQKTRSQDKLSVSKSDGRTGSRLN